MPQAVRTLWNEVSADHVTDMAAGLAYRFLLALFPFFIFLAAIAGVGARALGIDDPTGRLVAQLAQALPADARSVLTGQLSQILEGSHPGLLSFGLIGALYSASSGIASAMRAMNIAYDVDEDRPFWRRTALSLGLTALGGVFTFGAFGALVGARLLEARVETALGGGVAASTVLTIASYALAIVLMAVAAAVLYWLLPNAHLPFRWVSPGASMFVIGWIASTALFGWYVSNFASYNATYGAVGGVIVLMVWLYLTALLMLLGAELNAVIAASQRERADVPEHGSQSAPRTSTPAGRAASVEVRATRVRPRSGVAQGLTALAGLVIGVSALARALSAARGVRRPT